MEFLMILFVLIIVFNVINTAIQKAKGNQPERVVRVSPPGLSDIPPERIRRVREERPQPPEVPERAGEGKTLGRHGYDSVAVAAEAQRHGEEDEASNTAVTTNLTKLLSSKDDLVAAFIFHEILERPRSMQRR